MNSKNISQLNWLLICFEKKKIFFAEFLFNIIWIVYTEGNNIVDRKIIIIIKIMIKWLNKKKLNNIK